MNSPLTKIKKLHHIRGMLVELDNTCDEVCPNLTIHTLLMDIAGLTTKLLKKTRT